MPKWMPGLSGADAGPRLAPLGVQALATSYGKLDVISGYSSSSQCSSPGPVRQRPSPQCFTGQGLSPSLSSRSVAVPASPGPAPFASPTRCRPNSPRQGARDAPSGRATPVQLTPGSCRQSSPNPRAFLPSSQGSVPSGQVCWQGPPVATGAPQAPLQPGLASRAPASSGAQTSPRGPPASLPPTAAPPGPMHVFQAPRAQQSPRGTQSPRALSPQAPQTAQAPMSGWAPQLPRAQSPQAPQSPQAVQRPPAAPQGAGPRQTMGSPQPRKHPRGGFAHPQLSVRLDGGTMRMGPPDEAHHHFSEPQLSVRVDTGLMANSQVLTR